MHTKAKGSVGELAVALDLNKKGYCVFKELGDLSKTDLIVIIHDIPIKVQVKATTIKTSGVINIDSRKYGPNYKFKYRESDVDIFAIYIINTQEVIYLSAKEIISKKSTITIRINPSKQNQKKKVNFIDDFRSLRKALRDYTPRTLTFIDEGEEIVQTATEMARET